MVKLKSVGNFLKAMDPLFYELVLPLRFSIFTGKMPVFRDWLRVIVIASIKGSLIIYTVITLWIIHPDRCYVLF